MSKKIYQIIKISLLAVIIITAFLGCSKSNGNEFELMDPVDVAVDTTTEAATTTQPAATTSTTTTTDTTTSTTSTTAATISVSIGTTGKAGETAPTLKKDKTTKTTASTTSTTNTTTTTTSTTAINTCTLVVECRTILGNSDKLAPGHSEYVPADGYIIKSYTYTIKSDDTTAYDVLRAACKKNGVKLTAEKSYTGIYISGIGNIDEMDCGKSSGWKYHINGTYPPVSCSKSTVAPGDKIVFTYVV